MSRDLQDLNAPIEEPGGKARAFDVADLFREHRRELTAYARRVLGDWARADDAVQQAFASTYFALEGGTEIRQPVRWLQRCVRNNCLQEIRRDHVPESIVGIDEVSSPVSVVDVAHVRARFDAVQNAVMQLPDAQRKAFLLREVHGFSYEEIAERTGCTAHAVRKLLFRGRTRVRAEVGSDLALLFPAMPLYDRLDHAGSLVQRLHGSVAAAIAKIDRWIALVLQRLGESVVQPAVPIAAGAIIVATFGLTGQGVGGTSGQPAGGAASTVEAPVTGRADKSRRGRAHPRGPALSASPSPGSPTAGADERNAESRSGTAQDESRAARTSKLRAGSAKGAAAGSATAPGGPAEHGDPELSPNPPIEVDPPTVSEFEFGDFPRGGGGPGDQGDHGGPASDREIPLEPLPGDPTPAADPGAGSGSGDGQGGSGPNKGPDRPGPSPS